MTDIRRLIEIMARLRDPREGCPWDLEQDFASVAPYTLEEAYEVDHAIRIGDWDALCDELGDLLLQVVFHAQMAREKGLFEFSDVVAAICDKLVRRHPHVFGDPERGGEKPRFRDAEEQTRHWEESKQAERASRSSGARDDLFDGVPLALPALSRASKLLKRASRDARTSSAFDDLDRDAKSLRTAHEGLIGSLRVGESSGESAEQKRALGELLFECAGLARQLGLDPEDALRDANDAFEARMRKLASEDLA